jgi:hypothetical protein
MRGSAIILVINEAGASVVAGRAGSRGPLPRKPHEGCGEMQELLKEWLGGALRARLGFGGMVDA